MIVWRKICWVAGHWRELIFSILGTFGAIFLAIESYEVLTGGDVVIHFAAFLALGLLPGVVVFVVDGLLVHGFLKREVKIPNPINSTAIKVKFGDLFAEPGWNAIGVNDFFDSIVDEDLVSSKSLHGHVLNNWWGGRREDWERQINSTLRTKEGEREKRSKGNRIRYPIGTTARATSNNHNFLFVALGRADTDNYVTQASAEMLICAVRGMLVEARAACSLQPLTIPLMGSGLSRVGIKNSVLVDLIITAVLEESRHGKITDEIVIVLPEDKAHEINLKNHVRNWADGK